MVQQSEGITFEILVPKSLASFRWAQGWVQIIIQTTIWKLSTHIICVHLRYLWLIDFTADDTDWIHFVGNE
jgi:hypothetical protein